MRSYVPNTEPERQAMLKEIGLSETEELFSDIPRNLRLSRPLDLDKGKSEIEVRRIFKAFAENCESSMPVFRGAGAYRHYIPSVVPKLSMHSAFYTAYTPYQPEMSQGMLQAIFEYQTLICQLTGMDASNASVYDGATAAAESMLMARDIKRRRKILYSAGLHPDVQETLKTYARFAGMQAVSVPLFKDGLTDREALVKELKDSAGFILPVPNFYGLIENQAEIADLVHEQDGLLISYLNPISLGLLKRPGDSGADIAIGEGQPLGMPLSYGGPYLGFMACKAKFTRNLPGRISGETTDADGNRAYVLTLQAREQHIRRDKAASNICSNQMLCAITASIYLAVMGPGGLREAAVQSTQKAHYLAEKISSVKGMRLRYPNTPFFNEFVVDSDRDAKKIDKLVKDRGLIGGLPLSYANKGDNGILYCVTEMNSKSEMDTLISALEVSK
ncbi:MAG: putative glycine dehydrogenase (decarboxylating) subunit 1 [Firmicutes bacterium ADurb.Bin182]|nr:MAG: putative glycine dehydrogenase (decarboxylating) subunit 1 [Firmicutes bacterium ADurb.Bin182]